jgi:hypothetical protein
MEEVAASVKHQLSLLNKMIKENQLLLEMSKKVTKLQLQMEQ